MTWQTGQNMLRFTDFVLKSISCMRISVFGFLVKLPTDNKSALVQKMA